MSEYQLSLGVDRTPDEVFRALRQDLRSGGTSHRQLPFRSGLVRWTQEDSVDEPNRRIEFKQVDGDFVALSGEWAVRPRGSGAELSYRISLRTSVPHLAGAIDPVVARVFFRATLDIVSGIAGQPEILTGADLLEDARVG